MDLLKIPSFLVVWRFLPWYVRHLIVAMELFPGVYYEYKFISSNPLAVKRDMHCFNNKKLHK